MNSPAIHDCCDVAIVGAGPAGIAAAVVAAESGATVVLLDDNPGLGGQIWRGKNPTAQDSEAANWFERLNRSKVRWVHSARVFHAAAGELSAETPEGPQHFAYRKLILAIGARELLLPFPGWTLPNVMGAGALQALIKSGLPVRGKRVVIAGTGPLLLAVAACAKENSAQVVCIAEQTTWANFIAFGFSIFSSARKMRDALRLTFALWQIPHWKNCWPLAAQGTTRVESVVLSHNGRKKEIACDYLACGFHLIPNVELAQQLGCKLQGGFVSVDENQETSIAGAYCAGETTGIGGYEVSLLEGQIAGYAATNSRNASHILKQEREKALSHVRAMQNAFRLRDELKNSAEDKTLVCRCEDVALGRLLSHSSWRSAKLHTRVGMGPCQGRVCGPACHFLFDWEMDAPRPPIFPVQCSSLAEIRAGATPVTSEGELR
jgi:NADPH-dependent 2,4-dienoyl-CoA reductase/sulfur reductase-like enzyme